MHIALPRNPRHPLIAMAACEWQATASLWGPRCMGGQGSYTQPGIAAEEDSGAAIAPHALPQP
eukprot:scaffold17331_cov125-Isochrysis_galbana.AAC.3